MRYSNLKLISNLLLASSPRSAAGTIENTSIQAAVQRLTDSLFATVDTSMLSSSGWVMSLQSSSGLRSVKCLPLDAMYSGLTP
jgi:hypothetical protein